MLSIGFLNHGNLVQRETLAALRRLPDTRVVVIDSVTLAGDIQARQTCEALAARGCRVLVTINDWGLDAAGEIGTFMHRRGIVHVNWYVDDPFFFEIINRITFPSFPNRFDFVSDRGYVKPLRSRGYKAWFLPLATDPSLFFPLEPAPTAERDACFVGNSYRTQLDTYLKDCDRFMEEQLPFLHLLLQRYRENLCYDIEQPLREYFAGKPLPGSMTPERAVFVARHFVGYLFRKSVISSLAAEYRDFMVFGDIGWAQDLSEGRVSTAVGYYTNLNKTYQTTRVNIDINRMVIRDGFTQRVFDCSAAGALVITSPKRVIGEYFETEGHGCELVVFENEKHLRELLDYYRTHENEGKAIAARAREKVLALHTYDHRVRTMFSTISREGG